MENLSSRIYEERKKKNLSQGDLANLIGVSSKAISKWETGESQPTLENVAKLAKVFGCTSDYLLTGLGSSNSSKGEKVDQYLGQNNKPRTAIRIIGWILLPIGLVCLIVAGVNFALSATNFEMPSLFFLFYIGGPLLFIGIACLLFGYLGKINRYTAHEVAPVAKDTTNYIIDGTRDELKETLKSVKDDNGTSSKGPVCPKCGVLNETGAKFCDHCGTPLTKKCPKCGEENDCDSTFCRRCGGSLK
jgi:transcriptional regulator with XRE-family HTH domain/ribosomal protein L40E